MGKEARAKLGKYRGGGLVPIGYDYVDGKLVINEFEAMQIREIHRLYQQGYSMKKIAKEFADKGYKHKHGIWQEHRIKKVLTNPLYIGKIHYHDEYFDGEHEPIIDEETFNRFANSVLPDMVCPHPDGMAKNITIIGAIPREKPTEPW